MSNEEMLELIRIDRPEQFINKVVKIEDHELKRFGILYLTYFL